VTDISHVINYDIPDTVDAYTHRIGRTGRAENSGEAFTFVTNEDMPMVRSIERVLGEPIERRRVDGFDYGGFVPEQAMEQRRGSGPRNGQSRGQRRQGGYRGGNRSQGRGRPASQRNSRSSRNSATQS